VNGVEILVEVRSLHDYTSTEILLNSYYTGYCVVGFERPSLDRGCGTLTDKTQSRARPGRRRPTDTAIPETA
jgi:hypothetical protein